MKVINHKSTPHQSPNVMLVHGAIRRPVTSVWMESLRSHLANEGFQAECFFWSGIPLPSSTKAAAKELILRLEQLGSRPIAIWCKSTGADVVNLAAQQIRPDLVLQVAPTFAASNELVDRFDRVTVRLRHDAFLSFWERTRIVHQLDDAKETQYVIVGPSNIGHHELNYPVDAVLSSGRTVSLYTLYTEILDTAKRD